MIRRSTFLAVPAFGLALLLTIRSAAAPPATRSAGDVEVDEEVPAATIRATASSQFSSSQPASNLIDGTGMGPAGHDNNADAVTMWHTAVDPAPTRPAAGMPEAPAWVRFDFDPPRPIGKVGIWNHNQSGLTDRGFKRTHLVGTSDGTHWFPLAANGQETLVVPRAPGDGDAAASCSITTTGRSVRSVVLAADAVEGNYGGNVYGLSAVKFYATRHVSTADLPPPTGLDVECRSYYLRRPDGQPGRAITVGFTGSKLYAAATLACHGPTGADQRLPIAANRNGTDSVDWTLPPGVGVTANATIDLTLTVAGTTVRQTVDVPKLRQWTVYLYPQSHVDIGFTTTQDFVRRIHERNVDVGIDMGRASANYPAGARSVWNTEAQWVVESYLHDATPERRAAFIDAVKRGWIGLDCNYDNANTSIFSDEEFLRFFRHGMEMRRLTGRPVDTMVQFDVPGMSWGVVSAAAQCGVRGVLNFANDFARLGSSRATWEGRPFWWVAPDGKTRVLFLQGPTYATSVYLKGAKVKLKPAAPADRYPEADLGHVPTPVQDFRKDMDRVTTANPSALFLDPFIFRESRRLEKADWPYDIYFMAWGLWDNAFADGDLPKSVRAWNEKYAFPKVVISDAHGIVTAFADKFDDLIPQVHGDYTEYWTDGLGSDARRVGEVRVAKERLVDSQVLATLLKPGHPATLAGTDDAWRDVMLASEHTWGYYVPSSPFAKRVEAVKASYFDGAADRSRALQTAALKSIERPDGDAITVINTLSFPRTGVVTIHSPAPGIVDDAGRDVPAQRLADGDLAFLAADVPALGCKSYHPSPRPAVAPAVGCVASGNALHNGPVDVILDPANGDIDRLNFNGHEFVNRDSPYRLNTYRYLRAGDAPDKATGPSAVTIAVKEAGPIVASLMVTSKAEGCNQLNREVRLTAGDPRVECVDTIDKIATPAKEGVHFAFAFNLPGGTPRMDIPWGVMVPEADQIPGANRNWLACQRWVDLSNDRDGVTWTCAEMPLIEFGDITANIMGMGSSPKQWLPHLLKPRTTLLSWALNNHWFTNFPDRQGGVILFHYAILPHGPYDPAVANRFGLDRARPLIAIRTTGSPKLIAPVAVDNPRVFISALKPSDDGAAVILRLRSVSDHPEPVHLTFPAGTPKSIQQCQADEVPLVPAAADLTVPPLGGASLRMRYP